MKVLSVQFKYFFGAARLLTRRLSISKPRYFNLSLPLIQKSKNDMQAKIELIKANVKSYQDFPKQGVLFRDIFSVLREPTVFSVLRDVLVECTKTACPEAECIVGLDARGFLFGPLLALELSVPFVPVRKKGKLPGEVLSECYCLEYGQDTFQIQKDAVSKGMKVVLVDDLLATGGSLKATCALIEQTGATVAACVVIMELTELKGREKIPAPLHSILQY